MTCKRCFGICGEECPGCNGDGVVCGGCEHAYDECTCAEDYDDQWMDWNLRDDQPEDDS